MIREFCLFFIILLGVSSACWSSKSKEPLKFVLKVNEVSLGNYDLVYLYL